MATENTHDTPDSQSRYPRDSNRRMYQSMMDFGFTVLLPVGGAFALFFTLLLMGQGLVVSTILGILAWLGLLGFAKTFFSH